MRLPCISIISYMVLSHFSITLALPNGSPLCVSDAEKTSGCMGGDNTESFQYTINCGDCKVKAGGKIELQVNALVPFYHGILLYVQGDDEKDRVGSFKIDGALFKENSKRCKRFNYSPDSVLTHIDNSEKKSNTVFEWTAPAACPKSLTIRATFIYNALSRWQVIKPVPITCVSGRDSSENESDDLFDPSPNSYFPTPVNKLHSMIVNTTINVN